MGLGPPVCVSCRVGYNHIRYINEEGYECAKWFCPKCKREDSKDYALTIKKELFEEIYDKKHSWLPPFLKNPSFCEMCGLFQDDPKANDPCVGKEHYYENIKKIKEREEK